MLNSHEIITKTNILETLITAKDLARERKFEELISLFSPFWDGTEAEPEVEIFSKPVQAEILLRCGAVLGWYGDFKQNERWNLIARDWLTRSRTIYEELKIDDGVAEAEAELALVYCLAGIFTNAEAYIYSALEHPLSIVSDLRLKIVTNQLLILTKQSHNPQKLKDAYDIIIANDVFLDFYPAHAKTPYLINSAMAMRQLGEREEAIERYKKIINIATQNNDQLTVGVAENNLANIYTDLEEYGPALDYCSRAAAHFKEINNFGYLAAVLEGQSKIYLKNGSISKALNSIEESLSYLEGGSNYADFAESLWTKTLILLKLERTIDAQKTLFKLIGMVEINISASLANSYYEKYDDLVYVIRDISYREELKGFKGKLYKVALKSCGNRITAAAQKLGTSHEQLRTDIQKHHPDLEALVPAKPRKVNKKSKNKISPVINNIPFELPAGLKYRQLIRIGSDRLAYTGLIRGVIAVCVTPRAKDHLPIVAADVETGEIFCGFPDEFSGILGLLAENSDPLMIPTENAQIIGAIAGYCKLNEAGDRYDYFDLNL